MLKKFLLFLFLAICLSGIICIFWFQEIKYSLPTPVPPRYVMVALKAKVNIAAAIKLPAFIHFYNPACPCSKFNAAHVKHLIGSHGHSIQFTIVVPSLADVPTARNKFGEGIEYVVDHKGEIAAACGVYSTPQAVIVAEDSQLYFRGNYNRSRYCTGQATNYAELALLSFVNNQPAPIATLEATTSYGCQLPNQADSIVELF